MAFKSDSQVYAPFWS